MATKASGPVTTTSDTNGITVKICSPDWFIKSKFYEVKSPTDEAKDVKFSGDDLNFLARMIYAEATGSGACKDAAERSKEKAAILHVCYFRIGRKGYPSNSYIARSFTEVAKAPGQFESVFKANRKLSSSAESVCESLKAVECTDLEECLKAVRTFIETGPDYKAFPFDKFLASTGRAGWTKYGGNEFNLFSAMKDQMAKVAQ